MHYTTTVKLVLEDAPAQSLANVRIALFDRDVVSRDDALGTAVTDSNGEARFQYSSDRFVDLDDKLTTELPDLYAIVYDQEDQVVLNTRAEVVPNTPRKKITIPIARDIAQRHRLIAE